MSELPPDLLVAARWLAEHWHIAGQPFTRTLRERFGLPFASAVKVIAEARRMVGGR